MTASVGLPCGLDLQRVLESTGDCIYVLDRDWRFTYLNRNAIERIAGGRDLVGAELWAAFPGIEETAIGTAMRRAAAENIACEAEDYYPGLNAWFAARIEPLPGGLAVFFRDVSVTKANEAALVASDSMFRDMFETLTQGVVYLDHAGTIIDANPAAERILGLSSDQLRGRCHRDPRWRVIDAEGRDIAAEDQPAMIALRTGRIVRGYVLAVFNPSRGELRWLRVDAIPQRHPGSAAGYQVYALFSDITEQQRIEEALGASRAHLEAAQRVASIGSSQADFRTGKWEWSDETYRIYGRERATFTPTAENIISLVHPEDRDRFIADIESSRRGINPPPLEFRILRPNGDVRVLYREVALFRDEKGRVTGGIATKQDVTEARAAEGQREELQKQLLHAQRMDALGTLAGGIAHELNNILVPVLGLTEFLQASMTAQDPNRAVLDVIRHAGERARNLVGQILTFSRRETPDRRDICLKAFLQDTMRLVRASVPATITVEEEFGPVPLISADAGQLQQVLLNLVANAAQAIGSTIGTIAVSASVSHDGPLGKAGEARQTWICISVRDTGCGISEATQKRMFEPFFTTKPAGQGTGLGLSVVHGIVTAHGGTIQVTSSTGNGTCVDIHLPGCASAASAMTHEAVRAPEAAE